MSLADLSAGPGTKSSTMIAWPVLMFNLFRQADNFVRVLGVSGIAGLLQTLGKSSSILPLR